MTSFEFITTGCGTCHPGGGPMEYDRNGNRYDLFMKQQNLTSGGDNGLDGDYYKARWSETGVIEPDCLLCHLPEYDFKSRNAQLASLNFKWAATEAAGFGKVKGTVSANQKPEVAYDPNRFDADGNVIVHIAPEPRNETCLTCHAKPNWKKRGASFSHRTDVRMAAGVRCVDCHGAIGPTNWFGGFLGNWLGDVEKRLCNWLDNWLVERGLANWLGTPGCWQKLWPKFKVI